MTPTEKPTDNKVHRDARAFWPPADVEWALWFLNSNGDISDGWVLNFKVDGKITDAETFRKEQSEYRTLADAMLCKKRRITQEQRTKLKKKWRRSLLEPKVLEDADDQLAYDERQKDLKKLDSEFIEEMLAEHVRNGGDPADFKKPNQKYPQWLLDRYLASSSLGDDGERHFEEDDSPLRHFELNEGRLDDQLGWLYDFLLEAADKKRYEIRRCACGTYFYAWPQTPKAKFCSDACRAKRWRNKNRERFNLYQKLDRRKRREKPSESSSR